MSDPDRLHSLRCVVLAALDELHDLVDPDPAAAFARRAVNHSIACLQQDWLPYLTEAESFLESSDASVTRALDTAEGAPFGQHDGISERG